MTLTFTDDETFLARLTEGSYAGLTGDALSAALHDAAADMLQYGLRDELGALRLILHRCLREQDDLHKLAANIPRIVSATMRAVQVHASLTQPRNTEAEALLALLTGAHEPDEAEDGDPEDDDDDGTMLEGRVHP